MKCHYIFKKIYFPTGSRFFVSDMNEQLKVLMLGESLVKQGGIVSVQKIMLEHAPTTIQYQHLPTLVDGSRTDKVWAFGSALWKLCRKLSHKEVDLLHAHMSDGGSAFRQATIALIALFFHTPVVIHTHGPEFHLFYAKIPILLQQGLKYAFQRCSQFIVLSESWRKYYVDQLELSKEQVTVLPNAVRIPQQIPHRFNRSTLTLLFLGRIGQRKGAFDLVQAFANLPPEQRSRSRLILAGDGEVEALQCFVESLSLTGSIEVIGWISSAQRDVLLAEADVFALPSYNEGLPMSILEAMSWGLPIIATPVGGIPEVITSDNGLLITPGDIQQLTDSIQLLIENEALRLDLGDNARKSAINFDIEHYMATLVQIYYLVLGSHLE
jgi:glycosyltransferase involved in cell wall biosynthesis